MKLIIVKENEANQRLDKFLAKYMDKAPKNFFYKMLRKKNITLNKRKADGSERLQTGDEISLFLSEETIESFTSPRGHTAVKRNSFLPKPEILYEDAHILLFNKPVGLLSQKARPEDVSLVEFLRDYLLDSGQITTEELRSFRPGICSRLDRNTSGLVVAGKTLAGLQAMNELIRAHRLCKRYRCIAAGTIPGSGRAEGWLVKDDQANQVRIYQKEQKGSQYICMLYTPLEQLSIDGMVCTYLEIQLITGRSHQIRAHFASMGYPLLGDPKYGDPCKNQYVRRQFGLTHQLLHAFCLEFPKIQGGLEPLSNQKFTAPLPELFAKILDAGRRDLRPL